MYKNYRIFAGVLFIALLFLIAWLVRYFSVLMLIGGVILHAIVNISLSLLEIRFLRKNGVLIEGTIVGYTQGGWQHGGKSTPIVSFEYLGEAHKMDSADIYYYHAQPYGIEEKVMALYEETRCDVLLIVGTSPEKNIILDKIIYFSVIVLALFGIYMAGRN